MITIHEATATDFTTLGLGALTPTECTIEEKAGGLYELTLVQPFEDDLRHELIRHARIIKAPAPIRETPLLTINATTSEEITREIYKVTTDGRRLNMRTGPGLEYRILHAYKPGTEVVRTEVNGDWAKVIILDGGASGWMWAGNLTYVRSEKETIVEDSPGTVVKPRQTREQLFRICDIEPDSKLRSITVRAQHISYDLKGALVVGNYAPEDTPANVVCAQMVAKADHDISDFNVYCAVTDPVSGDYTDRNILDCLLDPETGVVAQTHARLVRDNYDIFILPGEGRDRGVELRYGKNLLSASMPTGTADIITRIRPVGKDSEGEPLYIEENNGFVDSPRIGEYPVIYSKKVEYDVAVSDDLSIEDARAQLKEKAQAEFEAGCDLPSISVDADFVRLELTEEYKELASAYALHLYDVVSVVDRKAGIVAKVRMTDYEYDGVLNRYKSTGLGDVASAEVAVYGYEIASGSIQGGKIVPNSMNGNRLRDLSVGYAKIDTAAIRQLSADSIVAIRADIRKLVAGEITTDQLYADLATIASAQITAANIEKANIQWAEIETLAAEIATIAQAEITTANIEKANIDWASIDNLTASIATIATAQIANAKIGWAQIEGVQVTSAQIALGAITTALISQGAVGTAQIADGSITSAKIVELTADVIKSGTLSTERLIIKGAGSLIYEINATAGGLTASQLTQEQYKNAISGTALVAKSVTADKIAAKTITANQIASNTITAAEINVANLFAAQATITALTNYLLKASTIEALQGELDVWAADKINLSVSNIRVGGANLIRASKTFSKDEGWDLWNCEAYSYNAGSWSGHKRIRQERTNSAAWQCCAGTPLIRLPDDWDGRELTLSAYLSSSAWAKVDGGITWTLCLSDGSRTRGYRSDKYSVVVPGKAEFGASVEYDRHPKAGTFVRAWTTFKMDEASFAKDGDTGYDYSGCTHMFVQFWLTQNGDVRMVAPKLEWGNKVSDWSPAPEDTDAEFENVRTEISLTNEQITLKADKTTVDALDKRVTTNSSEISLMPDKIALAVSEIRPGGTQLLRNTKRLTKGSTNDTWSNGGGVSYYDSTDGFMRGRLVGSDNTADKWYWIATPTTPLPVGWQGRQVTLSAYIYSPNWKNVDNGVVACLALAVDGKGRKNYGDAALVSYNSGTPIYGSKVQADRPLANNKWLRVSVTFTLDEATLSAGDGTFDDNTHMYAMYWLVRNGDFRFYAPKLEWGNKATDWSPAPEDTDAEFEDVRAEIALTKDQITLAVEGVQANNENLLDDSELTVSNGWVGDYSSWHARNGKRLGFSGDGQDASKDISANFGEIYITPGSYTVSCYAWQWNLGGVYPTLYFDMHSPDRTTFAQNVMATTLEDTASGGAVRKYTGTLNVTGYTGLVSIRFIVIGSFSQGDIGITEWKLERGINATDWSPYRETFSAGTNVLITKDEFRVTTPEFNVDITSEDGTENMLHIDKDGVYANALASPTVAPKYNGPTTLYVNSAATSTQIAAGNYFRSIADAIGALNYKWIENTVTVNIAAGHEEIGTITVKGIHGCDWINIYGASSDHTLLRGRLNIHYCAAPIRVQYIDIVSTGVGIQLGGRMTMAQISNCIITGPGTSTSSSYGVDVTNGAMGRISNLEIYDFLRSLYGQLGGTISASSCKGNCTVGANRTSIYLSSSMPCASTTWTALTYAGQVLTGDISVDQGSKPTTPTVTTTTVTYSMTNADNYTHANGSWTNYSDEDIRQGYTTTNGMHRGCFWFDNATIRSALKGKTIKQATLSLYQMSAGRSQPVQVSLEGITMNYSGRTGVPYAKKECEYGVIGTTLGVNQTTTFTIPKKVITDLVAGTINGLMLRNDENSVMTGDDNSYHFARFAGGTTTAYKPVLTVTYQT